MNRLPDAMRLLLGVLMVVTAIQYFLPSLLPFLPTTTWDDPMSVRLMTGFDKSGLLAVAMFIHFAAGALLLVNRAVPFALAALMPVNVCGLFISLFIEAEVGIGLFALLIMALNGLLMLAYLPYYRGVLDGGQLADGEGPEEGQYYESLFANPLSNAPTAAYLGGAVVLAAAAAFYQLVVPGLNSMTGLVVLAIPALILTVGLVRSLSRRKT